MFLERWFSNSELRPFLVLAAFIVLIIAVLIVVEWDHRRHIKLEESKKKQEYMARTFSFLEEYTKEDVAITSRFLERLSGNFDAGRKYGGRYSDLLSDRDQFFTKIEEYRNDFDGPGKAS